jgi:hypothetical protein
MFGNPFSSCAIQRIFGRGTMEIANHSRTALAAQISDLLKEQIQVLDKVVFVGWTPELTSEYNARAECIVQLKDALNGLGSPSGVTYP